MRKIRSRCLPSSFRWSAEQHPDRSRIGQTKLAHEVVQVRGQACHHQSLALVGTTTQPAIDRGYDRMLDLRFTPQSIENIKIASEGLNADLQASAEYRANLVSVVAERAVAVAARA